MKKAVRIICLLILLALSFLLGWRVMPRVWPDIKELSALIHKNNGKVFIAHPYRYNRDILEVLEEVKEYVDGIEICNNPNSKQEVDFLFIFAKENSLLVSCGSDYHGNSRDSLDSNYLTDEMLNDIRNWIFEE